jgi:hypothetical protein
LKWKGENKKPGPLKGSSDKVTKPHSSCDFAYPELVLVNNSKIPFLFCAAWIFVCWLFDLLIFVLVLWVDLSIVGCFFCWLYLLLSDAGYWYAWHWYWFCCWVTLCELTITCVCYIIDFLCLTGILFDVGFLI